MKNMNLDLTTILRPVQGFIRRYHSILFFVVLSGLIISAALVVLSIISDKSYNNSSASSVNNNFDTSTMQRVEELSPNSISKPSGRTNPFVE